jgi:myo-inositol-1-phosphate synthase
VWILGAGGNVGACTVAGWAAVAAGVIPPTGMVTASGPLAALPLVELDGVVFGGHEVGARTLADAVRGLIAEGVLPAAVIDAPAVRAALDAAQAEVRPGLVEAGGAAELELVRSDLRLFQARHHLERVVVLNLASTEAPLDVDVPTTWSAFATALRAGLRVPPSVIYAAAALDLGFAYVNFTPSTGSDLPALHAVALERGAVHAGADGKTGQTLLKTALAPMFAIRKLHVRSWISHNLLGNADGASLDDPDRRSSKQRTKAASLVEILGYTPEARVGIEYVPSYGDWKVAWDRVVFEGFGGAPMTLEMTWRGSDTALAAPLCIDLIRLVELAQRGGERGVLAHLGVFFKSPAVTPGGAAEHRLERQWLALLAHVLPEIVP